MRKALVTLTLLTVSLVGITAGPSLNTISTSKAVPHPAHPQGTRNSADPPGTIIGAKTPELIPDRAAYLVVFRLLSNRRTEEEKNRALSYVKIALGRRLCGSQAPPLSDNDINAFLATVREFEQKVGALDQQVKGIKDLTWPNPSYEVMAQLGQLQAQKEVIVDGLIASLPNRLSAGALENLRQHINERVKRKVKISPGPPPPGGPGLQHHH